MVREILVTARQAAMLFDAQMSVYKIFAVLLAGTEYKEASFVSVDTDKNVLTVSLPDAPDG